MDRTAGDRALSGQLDGTPLALALLAMSTGAFAIGTTEFATMGLLPQIAGTFAVTLPQAGNLVSAYAVGVVVGAPVIMLALPRVPRTRLILALAVGLALGNALSALAPTMTTALVARFLAGVPHGAYFGLASVVAARIAPPQRRAQSVSLVMVGLTVATTVGVPVSTVLGHQVGWRSMYWFVAAVALVAVVAILRWVPAVDAEDGANARRELTALESPQVWLAVGIGAIGFGGMFALYSYIAPITEAGGIPPANLPVVLALFGVGMTVGTLLGGRLADRSVLGAIAVSLSAMAVTLGLFSVWATTPVRTTVLAVLVAVSASIIGPALQTRLIDVARKGPSLGAALHHSAMNIGNAAGAWVGGLVIAAGFGTLSPAWAGALLASAGLLITAVSAYLERRAAGVGLRS